MKTADYVFGWLLVVASLMHGVGSVLAYRNKPELLLWAEAATLAGLLLAAINLLRAGRPRPVSASITLPLTRTVFRSGGFGACQPVWSMRRNSPWMSRPAEIGRAHV